MKRRRERHDSDSSSKQPKRLKYEDSIKLLQEDIVKCNDRFEALESEMKQVTGIVTKLCDRIDALIDKFQSIEDKLVTQASTTNINNSSSSGTTTRTSFVSVEEP